MASSRRRACWFIFPGPLDAPKLIVPAFVNIAGYVIVTNTGWNIDSILSAFVAGRQIFWVRLHEVVSFLVIAIAIGLAWQSVWGLVIATSVRSLTALVQRMAGRAPVRPSAAQLGRIPRWASKSCRNCCGSD